jgi:hypothetical protein
MGYPKYTILSYKPMKEWHVEKDFYLGALGFFDNDFTQSDN